MGARLLRARLEYGARQKPPRSVTQLVVAKELGVSGVAVGGWEADRNEPGLDYIKALAQFYGVRVGWIIEGELPMWRDEEGGQGAKAADPKPTNGPTRRTVETQVQFLDPKQPTQKGRAPKIKRRPPGRSASA